MKDPKPKIVASPSRYPRQWKWPGNEKIAFGVGLPFESFERQSQVNAIATKGQIDRYSLSYGDYGWKAGIWRLLSLLDEYQIKTSVATNGLAAERHPDIVKLLASEGHEITAHGWANDVFTKDQGKDAERAEIIRCTNQLKEVTGVRPVGWSSPGSSGSDATFELLREQGYQWVADDASDDLPFTTPTGFGDLVVLPRASIFTNDITMVILPVNPPSAFYENFIDVFDQLYAEGEAGCPKWIELTLHAHMAGRPAMASTIRKCFDYVRNHAGVFYARKCDVARWALEQLQPQ
jgi:peptidoglycan/xylan/chitin deacetylase (PgdA/CDA1 family)